MNKNKLSILIRYISLLVIAINTLTTYVDSSNILIILMLLIIVNSQFRFFNFQYNNKVMILSLIIDMLLILYLYTFTNTISIFYFIPILMDISFFVGKRFKYIMFLITYIFFILINLNNSFNYILENLAFLTIALSMFIYIDQASISTLNYQNTYDKLRISEDKLKKANSELEIYINSVEELAILKERNRISREIHDSVGHSLSTTIIQLRALENLLKDNHTLSNLVHELRDFVKDSFQEVRNAISQLKPIEYENYQNLFKIDELVKNFSKLTGTHVKLTISKNTWTLSNTQSVVLYRVIQESLSNAVRHGKCSKVDIFIAFTSDSLMLTIKDNGLSCPTIQKGNGLCSISERIYELKGNVEFTNSNDGFIIKASFPKNIGGEFIE